MAVWIGDPLYPRHDPAARRAYKAMWALKDYHKKRAAMGPDEIAALRAAQSRQWALKGRFSQYGMTKADYDEMFRTQGGNCAFCDRALTPDTEGQPSKIAIDHDHQTGAVRGLLHMRCNSIVGLSEKDNRFLKYMGLMPKEEGQVG